MKDIDPPAAHRPAADLAALAAEINHQHQAGEAAARKRLDHYRMAGKALLKAKEAYGRGGFLKWLEANVRFSRTQAYRYMELAKVPVTGSLEYQEAEWRRISGNAPAALDAPGEAPEIDLDDLTLKAKRLKESLLENFRESILDRREMGRLLADLWAFLDQEGVKEADRPRWLKEQGIDLSPEEVSECLRHARDEEELTRVVLERRLDLLFAGRS
jgi:hypothetical protein